eukprot:5659269-Prorocentrum_lima.AAC.1
MDNTEKILEDALGQSPAEDSVLSRIEEIEERPAQEETIETIEHHETNETIEEQTRPKIKGPYTKHI